jgi:hypothetical protein
VGRGGGADGSGVSGIAISYLIASPITPQIAEDDAREFIAKKIERDRDMELTAEEIARITTYLDATTPLPERADLIFVFGSRQTIAAQLAAQLYHEKRSSLIVVAGGKNRYTGHNEAELYHTILTDSGVPTDSIIVENRSTNTFENVLFAIPLIEQKVSLSSLESILAICKWMHSRRALMTLKRHLPRSIRYFACTYEPNGITRENWPLNPRVESANVLKHWESIPKYLELQQLEEIVRDGNGYI